MNFPAVITTPCIPTTPPPLDPRCSDPAFARAFPQICSPNGGNSLPVLVLKPSVMLTCGLGSTQFQAFVDQNGIETLLTDGVTFTTSDSTIAIIGSSTGSATGVGAGTATITAAYTTPDGTALTTTASMEVLGGGSACCNTQDVATMIVVDVSISMSQAFGNGYATKEAYALALASTYASQTNIQKDTIGLISFDVAPTVVIPLPSMPSQANTTAVTNAANALVTSQNLTGLGLAIQAAVNALSTSTAAIKVIVLITDGEDIDTLASDAPLPIAEAFENSGGIIVCVGIRAHDAGFNLLNGIASGGFFLNAYPSNFTDIFNLLMGLKGYLCAGNCNPPGDVYENVGALNYTGFINWNVTAGTVDLKGNGFLDVFPNAGLYVDMAGSDPNNPWGTLTSKITFSFTAGKNYRLSFYLAGNQQVNRTGDSILVSIGTNGAIATTQIVLNDWMQPLTQYTLNFTPSSNVTGQISFQQLMANPQALEPSGVPCPLCGNFLDNVTLTNLTDGTTLLSDTFDNENLQYILPSCGPGVKVVGGSGSLVANPNAVTVADNITLQVPNLEQCFFGGSPCFDGTFTSDPSVGACAYQVTLVNPFGQTSYDPMMAFGVFTPSPGNPNTLFLSGPIAPSATSWNIWRTVADCLGDCSIADDYFFIASVPIGTTSYADTLATTPSGASPPNSNTTQGSIGAMTPGESYTYAISYITANGQTMLSPSTTHVVGAGAHSLVIILPSGVPASVISVRVWRQETVMSVTRFYLLNTLTPGAMSMTDAISHAGAVAFISPLPAVPVSNTTGTPVEYFPYYGYMCYGYGCLNSPPGAQVQDPNPLPNIEIGYVPPTTYTSTKSFTATCPSQSVQAASISTVPIMTSANTPSGYFVSDSSHQTGFDGYLAFGDPNNPSNGWRTTGANTTDWVQVQLPVAKQIISFAITPNFPLQFNANTDTYQMFGSNDGVTFTAITAPQMTMLQAGSRYVAPITNPGLYLYYRFQNSYAFPAHIFGIGLIELFEQATSNSGVTESGTATSTISQSDADNKALTAATNAAYAALAYAGCVVTYTATESASASCACGTLGMPNTQTASASYTSFISTSDAVMKANAAAAAAATAALNCTASNNTQQIVINDDTTNTPTPATPYPSVQYVPATTKHITAITVTVTGFTHTYPQDVSLLLVSPTGKSVVLESHCGGSHSISGVNLVFSDTAGSGLPIDSPAGSGTPIVSGTFRPTQNITGVFPLCAPQGSYLSTLNSNIGDNPTGGWGLFVIDDKFLDVGTIASWQLNLTTA